MGYTKGIDKQQKDSCKHCNREFPGGVGLAHLTLPFRGVGDWDDIGEACEACVMYAACLEFTRAWAPCRMDADGDSATAAAASALESTSSKCSTRFCMRDGDSSTPACELLLWLRGDFLVPLLLRAIGPLMMGGNRSIRGSGFGLIRGWMMRGGGRKMKIGRSECSWYW